MISAIFDGKSKQATNHRMLLPEPATYKTLSGGCGIKSRNIYIRFPWIQRREGVDFHSSYMLS